MAVGDIGVIRMVGRFMDQNVVNTFHYEVTAQASDEITLWGTILEIFDSEVGNDWLNRASDVYTLVGYKMFTVKGDAKPPGFLTIGNTGNVAGDPQESFICRTLTLYSESANSRVRGRVMLSGGAESMFDDTDGSVTQAEITALSTMISSLLTPLDLAGDTAKLVLFNPTTDTAVDVIQAIARVTPSVVRSRRIKQFLIG